MDDIEFVLVGLLQRELILLTASANSNNEKIKDQRDDTVDEFDL